MGTLVWLLCCLSRSSVIETNPRRKSCTHGIPRAVRACFLSLPLHLSCFGSVLPMCPSLSPALTVRPLRTFSHPIPQSFVPQPNSLFLLDQFPCLSGALPLSGSCLSPSLSVSLLSVPSEGFRRGVEESNVPVVLGTAHVVQRGCWM